MSTRRIDLLEYLTMVINTDVVFLMRAPPIAVVSNVYVLPFNSVVWICSISLIILCTAAIALTISVRQTPVEKMNHLKASDFIFFAIASVCQRGSDISSKIVSTRISMVSHGFRMIFFSLKIHILPIFPVLVLCCAVVYLHFIHSKYSGNTSIHNQIHSNCL